MAYITIRQPPDLQDAHTLRIKWRALRSILEGTFLMQEPKLLIAFIFLFVLCVSAAWAEYDLAMRLGTLFSVASVSGLLALLGALLRAPEGYEDENGFHIRARRKQARHPRGVPAMYGSRR